MENKLWKRIYELVSILGFLYFSFLCYESGFLWETEGVLRVVLAMWVVFGYCHAVYNLGKDG